MKKKIGIVLLALLLTFSLVACRDAETPDEERAFAAYAHYLELIGHYGYGAWDADFTMDMDMSFMGMTFNMVSEGHSVYIIEDENNSKMYMSMITDMGVMGSMEMIMYMSVVDGSLAEMRMIIDGVEMPEADFDRELFDSMMADQGNVPVFDLGDIVSVDIEEDGNYTTFNLLLDISALTDFIKEMMSDYMDEMLGMLGDDAGFTFSYGDYMPLSLVVYGDDTNPVAITMTMEMSMTFDGAEFAEMDGEEIFMNLTIEYRYNAFGDDVVFEGF